MIVRPLIPSHRTPSELLRPLGAAVREALRAPRRVWVFNGVLALACAAVWAVAVSGLDAPAFARTPVLSWYWLALAFYLAGVLGGLAVIESAFGWFLAGLLVNPARRR